MTSHWALVEYVARVLPAEEREPVLGDMMEANESALEGLLGIAGLLVAASIRAMEKLAAVAGGVWSSVAEQFSIDGSFAFGVVELHAAAVPGFAGASCADEAIGDCGAFVASAAVDRSGMDRRVCGRLAFEENAVGEHAALLFALPDLPVEVSH